MCACPVHSMLGQGKRYKPLLLTLTRLAARRFFKFITGDSLMQWQTPTACDFRFGFEITMYVAAR